MCTQILTNLSVPSVILAADEDGASWYGSLRGGVEFGGGNDASFQNGASRWGVKGSAEMSEGLTAVYQFESKVSTADASQPGGRLAYVGVSGGFGTITLGQIWNAAYNHVGSITDGSWFYGNSHTGYRHGNAVSYATTVGPVSMQLDAILDSGMNTDSAVDKVEFGMTVDLGDIGKVALAHTNMKDTMKTDMVDVRLSNVLGERFTVDADGEVDDSNVVWRDATTGAIVKAPVSDIMPMVGKKSAMVVVVNTAAAFDTGTKDVIMDGGKYYDKMCDVGNGTTDNTFTVDEKKACGTETEVLVTTTSTDVKDKAPSKTYMGHAIVNNPASNAADETLVNTTDPNAQSATATASVPTTTPGSKKNHIAVQLSLGPVTGYVGHSTIKENGSGDKDKVTHYGLSGGLGDSGFSFHAMGRKVEKAGGMETSPWLIGLTKGLGGGATAMIEHGNDDDGSSGMTQVGLMVNF